ncbi:unnamed protein product [Cyclocybe aegerita]|uniref:Uncharacterized protein n=1 Tax=Cyclocybe aegerita TaxID=1973307 RepID=A0A8S0W830_CYCAE|nr:unnamed protein product [Cyclocybe aegerita]
MCPESRAEQFLVLCQILWIVLIAPFLTPPITTLALSLIGTGVLSGASRPHLSAASIALSSILGGLFVSTIIVALILFSGAVYPELIISFSPFGLAVARNALNIFAMSVPVICVGSSFLLGLQSTGHPIVKEYFSGQSVLLALEATLVGCAVLLCLQILGRLVCCLFIPFQTVPRFLFASFIGGKDQWRTFRPKPLREQEVRVESGGSSQFLPSKGVASSVDMIA